VAWMTVSLKPQRINLAELKPGSTPRVGSADSKHIALLAESQRPWPPVILHRSSMRVIDGHHRVKAAPLRGETCIDVVYFNGTDAEAFVLAVHANSRHSLP
jgi:ParB-like chromosome segregation protein Spo0J